MRRNGIDRCHHPDSYFCPAALETLCHLHELSGTFRCHDRCRNHGASGDSGILNIAVVTNTIPNTGITLPFISYGGTSIVFLLGEMGLALNVSRQKNNPPTR